MQGLPKHLKPRLDLCLRVTPRGLEVSLGGNPLGSVPLTLGNIHALLEAMEPQLLVHGVAVRMAEATLRTPLGFEALLEVIKTNMIHCTFPRTNATTPLRSRIALQSMDAEVHFVRNATLMGGCNHAHVLADRYRGIPALIAMPGPSLDMDRLRELRQGRVLLAAGRAAGKLLSAGVDPDLVYMQDVNARAWDCNFAGLDGQRSGAALVANPLGKLYAYHGLFARTFKAWNLYPFERDRFPKLEEIPPSSLSGAYSLARLLGCDPIIVIGNDGGDPVPPAEGRGVASMTSLGHRQEDGECVFEPVALDRRLYLRFADEFSVRTSNEYVCGAQWLKARARRDFEAHGLETFDISSTGLCRFNATIRDGAGLHGAGPAAALPPLPRYEAEADPGDYLRHKRRAYAAVTRVLERGELPGSVFHKPYSCLLTGTAMAREDAREPRDGDMDIIRANAAEMLDHADAALAGAGAE